MGLTDPDDAAVWRLSENRALVVTTDFFTPVVDSPFEYGAIAAANSLSDVYAMGGEPFLALNIAALPDHLPLEVSSEILRGGAEKAREAGVVIAGGHTVKDKEPKFGLVVIGFINPQQMIQKGGLAQGDVLVLTKPLGVGVTTTAIKQEKAQANHIQEAIEWMSRLNKTASQLALDFGIRGGTDITGFGLAGHSVEMALGAKHSLHIEYKKLPFFHGAKGYAQMGCFPGGAFDNQKYYSPHVRFASHLDESDRLLCFDPQTSGGLLLGVPQASLTAFQKRAEDIHQPAWIIGEVGDGQGIVIE